MNDLRFIITAAPSSRFRVETPPLLRLKSFLNRIGRNCGLEVSDVKHEGEAAYPGESYKPKRIRKQSPAQRKKQAEWNEITRKLIEQHEGACQVRSPECTGRAIEGHHRRPRSLGGRYTEDNCVPTCRSCHNFIKQNETWAKERGVLE